MICFNKSLITITFLVVAVWVLPAISNEVENLKGICKDILEKFCHFNNNASDLDGTIQTKFNAINATMYAMYDDRSCIIHGLDHYKYNSKTMTPEIQKYRKYIKNRRDIQNDIDKLQAEVASLNEYINELLEEQRLYQNIMIDVQGRYQNIMIEMQAMQGRYQDNMNAVQDVQGRYHNIMIEMQAMQGRYQDNMNAVRVHQNMIDEKYQLQYALTHLQNDIHNNNYTAFLLKNFALKYISYLQNKWQGEWKTEWQQTCQNLDQNTIGAHNNELLETITAPFMRNTTFNILNPVQDFCNYFINETDLKKFWLHFYFNVDYALNQNERCWFYNTLIKA